MPRPVGTFGRRFGAALIAVPLLLAIAAPVRSAGTQYAGRPLDEVLSGLRSAGLEIVYSSAVVRTGMRVEEEPRATDPRAVLDEVLAPHGLMVRETEAGVLVVVVRPAPDPTGAIEGHVRVRAGTLVARAVRVRSGASDRTEAVSDDGRFTIDSLAPGVYSVAVESSRYAPTRQDGIRVVADQTTTVTLQLEPPSVFLDEVIATPSHFRLLEDDPDSRRFLSREEVERMPHAADDLYRAVRRLPGNTGADYSAQFNVRGGEADELLVLLDGAQLYEPFHLKDFLNLFSIVDSATVSGVDVLTGGFPAEYGDRMSGVMDIRTAARSGSRRR